MPVIVRATLERGAYNLNNVGGAAQVYFTIPGPLPEDAAPVPQGGRLRTVALNPKPQTLNPGVDLGRHGYLEVSRPYSCKLQIY